MDEAPEGEKKIFSYAEATALLPEVRRLTEEAVREVETLATEAAEQGRPSARVQTEIESVVAAWARTLLECGVEVRGCGSSISTTGPATTAGTIRSRG